MHDLAPFIQLKKHEKHPWESVAFSKVTAGGASQGFMKAFIKHLEAPHVEAPNFTKSNTPPWMYFLF